MDCGQRDKGAVFRVSGWGGADNGVDAILGQYNTWMDATATLCELKADTTQTHFTKYSPSFCIASIPFIRLAIPETFQQLLINTICSLAHCQFFFCFFFAATLDEDAGSELSAGPAG